MTEPNFWDDQDTAQKLINDTNRMKEKSEKYLDLQREVEELKTTLDLVKETQDSELDSELSKNIITVIQNFKNYELSLLLSGKYDNNNALLEIHPGAGGTEAMDWGQMLFRMYSRWADRRGLKIEVENYESGDEAGIKSVSIRISGKNAFGLLKSEHGVHRLVRISPFDSANRRHTSFASVEVIPEIDQSINIEINSDDLRIDVFRSSGAGGQHINKTSSAVRITHLPTGIVTSSQAQRSQLQNRETAMNMLRAKLFQLEEEKKREQTKDLKGNQKEINFGSQIRSYVFHPYNLIKDHRTNYETSDTTGVMDGKIDDFMYAYLQLLLSNQNPE